MREAPHQDTLLGRHEGGGQGEGGTEVLVAPCRIHHEGLAQRASPSQHPINTVRVFDTLPLRCSDRPQFRAPLHLMS